MVRGEDDFRDCILVTILVTQAADGVELDSYTFASANGDSYDLGDLEDNETIEVPLTIIPYVDDLISPFATFAGDAGTLEITQQDFGIMCFVLENQDKLLLI